MGEALLLPQYVSSLVQGIYPRNILSNGGGSPLYAGNGSRVRSSSSSGTPTAYSSSRRGILLPRWRNSPSSASRAVRGFRGFVTWTPRSPSRRCGRVMAYSFHHTFCHFSIAVLMSFQFTSISSQLLFQYLAFVMSVVYRIFSFRARRQFQPLYFVLYYTPKWVPLSTPSLFQTRPSSLFLFW